MRSIVWFQWCLESQLQIVVTSWRCQPRDPSTTLQGFDSQPRFSTVASKASIERCQTLGISLKMSRRILRPRSDICHLCDFLLPLASARQVSRSRYQIFFNTTRTITTTRKCNARIPTTASASRPITSVKHSSNTSSASSRPEEMQLSQTALEICWLEAKTTCEALLALERAPSEMETLEALRQCALLVDLLVFDLSKPPPKVQDGAVSALLTLDNSSAAKLTANKLPITAQRTMDDLSKLAYTVIKHPTVFITTKVLESYTGIQANLGKPQSFPEVFQLYTNKPLPLENTKPIRYSNQNPNKIANAVPDSIADRALQSAIDQKQLIVAMDIVESTYTTTAYLRAKFIRKCLLPATGVVAAPLAAYTVASQLALLQTSMDSALATNVAFAGILAYTFFTGTIGIVAVTTANDNMDRVTWAPGIPLRDRYMREEERAAIDKIAGSWGFRESWRRGEEEGEDWDVLREWIGNKGMILDRVELMEGME